MRVPRKGWVELVWKDWVPTDEEWDGKEPLENNVGGWIVILDMFALLRDLNTWFVEYRRPPAEVCA